MEKICKIVYFDEESVTDYVQIVAGGELEKTTELLNSREAQEGQSAQANGKVGISGVFKALLGWDAGASAEVSAGLSFNSSKMVKKRDYEAMVDSEISEDEVTIPFMDLIQHYNARLRPNESGVRESALSRTIKVDNCIVRADDYGSVLEHVLSNFVTIVTLNHDIGTLFVHNPPRRVRESLCTIYRDEIEYRYSEYPALSREKLKELYSNLDKEILGQEVCKKQIASGIYRLITNTNNRPVVLMLYGPSGVGKTESAKSISKTMGGELLRVQFSMMQTNEAYEYVFGAGHSKSSFARDMMSRESNVILIDEFDKVNPSFYNAFYELFDEGRYVDTNYDVNLGQTIFLLTCNFRSEDEIKKILGPAMFSRIGCCIEYKELSTEQKKIIVSSWYDELIATLREDEQEVIATTDIRSWFLKNAERYDNIRILKTKMENAFFDKLVETFIIA